jgi:predicted Zn-dependent protease
MSESETPLTELPRSASRRRQWLVLSFLVISALGIAAVFGWKYVDRSGRSDALKTYQTRPFEEAEPLLKQTLASRPGDAELLDSLARGYMRAGRHAEAETVLSRLVELQPDNVEYRRLRVEADIKLDRREEAFADTQILLLRSPDDMPLRRQAMNLAFALGHFAEAEVYCRELMSHDAFDRHLRIIFSDIRRARGDDEEAARVLDGLIQENAQDYGALLARGILYDETGNSDRAIPLLRRVYQEDRNRRRTSGYQLALALGKVGQQVEADQVRAEVRRLQNVELFHNAIESRPGDADLQVRLAETLLADGYDQDGLAMLNEVLKKSPSHPKANLVLAAYYEKHGKPALADEYRRRASGEH